VHFGWMALAVMGCLPGGGCARDLHAARILDDLRRDGLLVEVGDEPRPAAAPAVIMDDVLPVTGDVMLAQLLDAADRLNPTVAAARARIGIAGAETWQAGVLENPTLELESENIRPSDGGFGVSETTVGIVQSLTMGGRRTAAIATGNARTRARRWDYAQSRREVRGRIRREATEIVFLRDSTALHHDLLELAGRTSEIASRRFGERAAPESEAIRARIEMHQLGLGLERLDAEMREAEERLAALLGGHRVEAGRVRLEPNDVDARFAAASIDELKTLVRDRHPGVRAAQSEVEAAERAVEEQRARQTPDITARLAWGVDHDDDEQFLEAGLGVPLTIFDRNDSALLVARFDVIRARGEARAVEDDLCSRAAQAHVRYTSASGRLAVFETQILDSARRSFDQTREGYQAGRLPFLDLLDAQRTLTEAALSHLELARVRNLALADLYAILGDDPGTTTNNGAEP